MCIANARLSILYVMYTKCKHISSSYKYTIPSALSITDHAKCAERASDAFLLLLLLQYHMLYWNTLSSTSCLLLSYHIYPIPRIYPCPVPLNSSDTHFFSRLPAPVSRKPFAKGLLSIFSWVICKRKLSIHYFYLCYGPRWALTFSFWYAVTAINSVSLNTYVRNVE